jgi:hypothetical protein
MIQLLVPPSKSGGVYDFACKLQAAIGQDAVRLVHLSKQNAADWIVSPEDSVVLQLSIYGFQNRGVPLWLLHELERRRNSIKTFGVFFHELYAFGPPWSSSFWLSPVQRYIVRRLAEMSDFWMTSREGAAHWLRRYAGGKPYAVLPVFSTIGEPDSVDKIRQPKIILFGSAGLRQAAYQAAGDKLFQWAKRASLEIHDIGTPVADERLLEIIRTNGVAQHGRLDEEEVRRLMQDARFGLLAYSIEYVAKSSVFAAYCAHGICPVLFSKNHIKADGLVAGVHCLTGVPDASTIPDTASIGQAAWGWYKPHSLDRHAESLLGLLLNTKVRKC